MTLPVDTHPEQDPTLRALCAKVLHVCQGYPIQDVLFAMHYLVARVGVEAHLSADTLHRSLTACIDAVAQLPAAPLPTQWVEGIGGQS